MAANPSWRFARQEMLNDYTHVYKLLVKRKVIFARDLYENKITTVASSAFAGLTSLRTL